MPQFRFTESGDAQILPSPHGIFRPVRSRYPMLVREHVDTVDAR